MFAYYFSHNLCPSCLNGNKCFTRKARILHHIYSDFIYHIFITVVLSMSDFQFEATDLLNIIIVSGHCWAGFSGCLISCQCKNFTSVSQQIKCQGDACSSPSVETMFCQRGLCCLPVLLGTHEYLCISCRFSISQIPLLPT